MVLAALVYRLLVWCGVVGYVSGLWDILEILEQRTIIFFVYKVDKH